MRYINAEDVRAGDIVRDFSDYWNHFEVVGVQYETGAPLVHFQVKHLDNPAKAPTTARRPGYQLLLVRRSKSDEETGEEQYGK